MKRIVSIALLSGAAFAIPAQAAYVVNFSQTGSDVVVTGSGSIDLSGLTFEASGSGLTGLRARGPTVLIGGVRGDGQSDSRLVDAYAGYVGPASIGPGLQLFRPTSGSGERVGITAETAGRLFVPRGYVSGADLGTSTSIFSGQRFATLGLTEGSYVYRLGSADDADTFTVNIGVVAGVVPEPATWAMMLAGFGFVGGAMRLRQRRRVVG